VDDEDYEYLSKHNWCAGKGNKNQSYYAVRSIRSQRKTRRVYMHRVIAQARPGEVVDHKNLDGLDNQRENLRVGNQALNLLNRSANKGRKYKGVSFYHPTLQYVASFRGKHIGYFDNEDDAARAYNATARAAGGDWALLNVIPGMSLEESATMPYRPRRHRNRYRGVRPKGRQWEASIQHQNQRYVIGYYPIPIDAARAYNDECDRLGCPKRKNKL
jgi:hypothetical protein